jgi:hypothetical protein
VQSRRDDLESLGYIMIYFCRGSLPWQGLKALTEDERNELIKDKKMNTPIEDLCRGIPNAFTSYFKYVQTLGFEDGPNYSYLRKLFSDLFVHELFQYDHVFDWTIKKFLMMDSIDEQAVLQTRSLKKSEKRPHDLANVPSPSRLRSSSGRPIDHRISKSTQAGKLRRAKTCKQQ